MNSLLQNYALLIGSSESISDLSKKENAKLLVISDSHGNYDSLRRILLLNGEFSDALIFCGDGILDLLRLLDEFSTNNEFSKYLPPVIGLVEGNNDEDNYCFGDMRYKIPLANEITVCEKKIFFVHGHRHGLFNGIEGLENAVRTFDVDAVFFGHTHIAVSTIGSRNILYLNPGSCSRPRGGMPTSYCVVKVEKDNPRFDVTFYELLASESKPFIPSDYIASSFF